MHNKNEFYNLVFWTVFVIKKLYPGGDFNFYHHHPTSSVSGHFIYIPDKNQNYTNSIIQIRILGQTGVP